MRCRAKLPPLGANPRPLWRAPLQEAEVYGPGGKKSKKSKKSKDDKKGKQPKASSRSERVDAAGPAEDDGEERLEVRPAASCLLLLLPLQRRTAWLLGCAPE